MKITVTGYKSFLAQTRNTNLFAFRRFVETYALDSTYYGYIVDRDLRVVHKISDSEWFHNGDPPLFPWKMDISMKELFYDSNYQ